MSETTKIQFAALPDLLKEMIARDVSTDINIDIGRQFGISGENVGQFMFIIRKVIFKSITLEQLTQTITTDLGVDASTAKRMALELLGRRFLPMEWYLGDVEGLITQLGGDVASYLAEAEKNYPEVYHPELVQKLDEQATAEEPEPEAPAEASILHLIDERLQTNKGRAEVLLRLTALSQEIEEATKSGALEQAEAEHLLHSLDALSYAVNTQDLNPLEVAAIKRRLKKVLAKLDS